MLVFAVMVQLYYYVYFLFYFPLQPPLISANILQGHLLVNWLLPAFGIDRLTILFFLLTTFIMPIVVLVLQSYSVFSTMLILGIELLLLICLLSLSLVIFYFLFELIVLLNYLSVSRYGSKLQKVRSSVYLFLQSLFGAVFLLVGIILLLLITATTNIILQDNFN